MSEHVTLHYHRPPDRTDIFVQELIYADESVVVSYMARTPMKRPMIVDGRLALEQDSPAVWFTFPGLKHDVGRFHTADGVFTGLYANVLEPVQFVTRTEWHATDLFLDVWVGVNGEPRILDRDELKAAVEAGAITREQAELAETEAAHIVAEIAAGRWPPPIVNEWPIERVTSRQP